MSGARTIDDDEVDDIPLVPATQPAARQTREAAESTEFEIIEVADDFVPGQDTQPAQGADARGDEETEQPQANETHEQRRVREDKSTRRTRQKEARDRTMAENRALQARLAELEERLDGRIEPRLNAFDESRARQNMEALDRQIAETASRAKSARQAISEAMIAQDAEALNAAMDQRDEALIAGQQLQARKAVIERTGQDPMATPARTEGQPQARREQAQPAPATPLPRAARELMSDFQAEHDWINPQRGANGRITDPDSRMMMFLDNEVANDGFNPSTPEYWEELRDRAAKALPHRFAEAPRQAPQKLANGGQPRAAAPERRGPMVGAGNNGANRPAANKVYLTAGRKDALIKAGILEQDGRTVADTARFQRMMKGFQKYDAENGVARQ